MAAAEQSPVVGIDFGTTNSSVALRLPDGSVRLAEFPSAGSTTRSSRSVLYLQRKVESRKPAAVWSGPEAIDRYLDTDSHEDEVQGRLIQSLKSYLSSRTFTGTEIFGRNYRVEDLVAKMLLDLRTRASASLGVEITRAVAGRPVHFVGADVDADNDFAEARLRASFLQAGFTDVTFAMEPVAAAYAYAADVSEPQNVLIGDFGGGTTDFSLLKLGPGERTVLGTTGVGLAGDAFDAKIVRYLISPALGADTMGRELNKLLPALPAWIYANLERWHTLSFLRTRNVTELLRTALKRAVEPEKIALLQAVVEHDLGYRLHQAVQRVKIDLSSAMETEFVLNAETVHLRAPVTRAEFEGWIAPELQRIRVSLDDLLEKTKTGADAVDRVFLTGGTSLVPAVRQVFTERFGADRVIGGEAFTSVAHGLALMAAE
ncbi:molecular chaperone [Terriglobus roseus DSM 18391]|uniref:Molecular chaperone n=1 Tax=Terriglobus roseus (strain DSM 18391 / NRRL B-41598 / KBS 63) TaxID=926566 RepID=I3ZB81_TERRK|nr:Hsp70 family protein [Terriglobus roseus]AFL86499.1 molecular chaperone [Terriglobus roseus DSM 18391]